MPLRWWAHWPDQITRLRLSWNALVAALIFLAPTHFFLTLSENSSYVQGLRIDYLIPKLYASVCIAALVICWWLWYFKPWRTWQWSSILSHRWEVVLISIFAAAQLSTTQPSIAFWFLFQATILIAAAWLILKNRSLLYSRTIIATSSAAILFQTSIALWQWTQQQSLVGYLLLGEPDLSTYAGLAKTTDGAEWILPYGTTAHPNVLGGFLAVLGVFMLAKWMKQTTTGWMKNWLWMMILVSLAGVLLTQSSSALLAFCIGGAIVITQRFTQWGSFLKINRVALLAYLLILITIPLIMPYLASPEDPSWFRRVALNQAAIEMLQTNPIIGVGLNHFTLELESFAQQREFVRFVQPAHHVPLLLLAETGALGLLLVSLFFWKRTSEQPLSPYYWSLLPLLALDHYMLTMPVGILSIGIISLITEA